MKIVCNQFKAEGYDTKEAVFKLMLTKLEVKPEYVPDLKQYLHEQSEVLVKEKQIHDMPDWSRILDTSVLAQATKSEWPRNRARCRGSRASCSGALRSSRSRSRGRPRPGRACSRPGCPRASPRSPTRWAD